VFRVREDRVQPVPVTVRYDQDSLSSIDGALAAGDQVVIEGQSQLKSGAAVKVMAAPP
jgi:multidrug efflux pump subunit AcrA (membrane-fusion protein)